jgi:hypothetical protein
MMDPERERLEQLAREANDLIFSLQRNDRVMRMHRVYNHAFDRAERRWDHLRKLDALIALNIEGPEESERRERATSEQMLEIIIDWHDEQHRGEEASR